MKKNLVVFGWALLGAICGNFLFGALPLNAAKTKDSQMTYEIYNSKGTRTGTYTSENGDQGALFLFSDKGKNTVQMGSYPNGQERGQALFGLNDPTNQLRMLLRLHSTENSPTIILKDQYGIDKIVIGLRGQNQTPYFEYVADDGRTYNLLK